MIEITKEHIQFIQKIAWKFAHILNLEYRVDDFISIGHDKLINAQKKYDSNRGVRFTTFVYRYLSYHYIRLQDKILKQNELIGLNNNLSINYENYWIDIIDNQLKEKYIPKIIGIYNKRQINEKASIF